ncbi:ABC transporter permease [Acidimicrobiia bacterium]|jgi:putative ABC transport system permease protein|nr:ABC transporter permease [Acidimicrobiia bacterium]MDB4814498.1 ABC transporter permease [Acidimicrobiia bacterium]MDB4833706.1 ABC transporter permease [Acidimicrobiia bacterium]MDC0871282.1 ABC transporter permease [Acidimicrobiia bacterium]|tara:strand:- start:935 stop:2116 length:1182 start_codon:yes stop_codon:yes gene_type:complete
MKQRLKIKDLFFVALYGVRARRGRAALTSIGIGIGIAAIVAVTGISASGRADLLATLESLGTNLIKASPQAGFFGTQEKLPDGVVGMVERIGPVEEVTSTTQTDLIVRRSDFISEFEGGGISTIVTSPELLQVVGGNLIEGRFIQDGLSNIPVTVLGSVTASRLGINTLETPTKILIGNEWFGVVGILDELKIHPDLDRSVFIGYGVAKTLFDIDKEPTTIYVRANPTYIEDVVEVIAPSMNPENPDQVQVSRPSDALEAQEAADAAFTNLLLGLGSVALLVGGVAIANVMVMSVLERRMEIGVRRSIGATRREIRYQFLLESIVLSGIGGLVGVVLGTGVTLGYTNYTDIVFSIPVSQVLGAILLALLIGAISGVYPAIKASKIQPAEAVRK